MNRTDTDMYARVAEEILRRRDISYVQLARELGCNYTTVQVWMRGEGVPGPYFLRRLHNLGYDIIYMLTGERNHA